MNLHAWCWAGRGGAARYSVTTPLERPVSRLVDERASAPHGPTLGRAGPEDFLPDELDIATKNAS